MIRRVRAILDRALRPDLLLHPGISVAPSAAMRWQGVRIGRNCRLVVSSRSIVRAMLAFEREGAEILVGSRTFIGGGVFSVAGRIEIGDDVLMAWGCTVVDHDAHSLLWEHRDHDLEQYRTGTHDWTHVGRKPVRVSNRAWIGFNATILKGVVVGEGAVVAACSVVTRDVPPYALVAGNPAKVIRRLHSTATPK